MSDFDLQFVDPEVAQAPVPDEERPMFTMADLDDEPGSEPDDFEGSDSFERIEKP